VDDVLYASSNWGTYEGLLGFELTSGELLMHLEITEKVLLNDITSDMNGNLYVTDSDADKIYRVHVANETYTVFVDEGLDYPNGIFYDEYNNRLLVLNGMLPNRPIIGVDLEDSATYTVVETGISSIDGLTADGKGNYYFSSWQTDCIYMYDEDFTGPPEVVSSGHVNPADIFYNLQDEMLAVPNFDGDTLELIPMGTTGVEIITGKEVSAVASWPNPFRNATTIGFTLAEDEFIEIGIFDLSGRLLRTALQEHKRKGEHQLKLNAVSGGQKDLQPGIYFCKFKAGNTNETIKLIKID
jgi:hypothetical protein